MAMKVYLRELQTNRQGDIQAKRQTERKTIKVINYLHLFSKVLQSTNLSEILYRNFSFV